MSGHRRIPLYHLAVSVLFCLAFSAVASPKCVWRLSLNGRKSLRSVGGKVFGGTWEAGRTGQAWQSRGGNDRIVIPNKNRLPRESATIEMFFKVDAPNTQDGGLILFDCLGKPGWWNRYCGRIVWAKGQANAGLVIVSNKDVQFACDSTAESPIALEPGKWHHYAATWRNVASGGNDAEMRVFVDGVEVAQLCSQSIPVTNMGDALWLGNAVHSMARAKVPNPVLLDDVRVWDGVLPAYVIAQHAAAQAGEKTDELLGASVSSVAIRPVIEAPTMDGKVADKTWQYAQCLTGFRDYHKTSGPLVPLQATVWLTYDANNLYAAWRCDMAAEKPVGDARKWDGAVFNDESMEFLFLSPAKPDTLFHFIGNAYGSIYDEKLIAGQRDRKWNGPWEYRVNFVAGKYWEAELRIPLRELGLSAPKVGDQWRVNLARNGFEPQYQSVWSHTTKGYADGDALAKMTIAGPGPVVSGITFPELVVGENPLNLRYASTAKDAMRLAVECVAEVGDGKIIHTLWERLADNTMARTDATQLAAPREGLNRVALRIVDEADGTVVLHQPMEVAALPPLNVTVTGEFPENYALVAVDARKLEGGSFAGSVELQSRDGKTIKTVALSKFTGTASARVPLDGVAGGDYQVAAKLKSTGGSETARTVPFTVYAKPDCVSETAGLGGVMPPWTPLEVKGNAVQCWNRVYTFGDGPFPSSLVSAGENIFTEPPRFVWRVGNRKGELKKGTFTISESSGDAVKFAGALEDELFRIDYTGTMEFDGAVFYDMAVKPKRVMEKVDEFALEFKLKPDAARFFLEGHAENVRKERNVLPEKPGERVTTKFLPMVALCGNERGLQWFCETDEGWTPYDRKDTMVMERQPDAMLWRFNIKQGGPFKATLHMNWGLLATPVKPLAKKRDAIRVFHFWPGGPVRSTPEAYYRSQVLKEVAKYGGKVITLHSYWADVFGSTRPYDLEKFKAFVDEAHKLGIRVTVYMSGLGHLEYPDALYYGDRWPMDPRTGFKSRPWERKEISSIVRCAGSKSFRDWLCGGVERLLRETGCDGLYYDWGCSPCRNHKHGCGYLPKAGSSIDVPQVGDEEIILGMAVQSLAGPWAKYRRTTPVRAQRELWKRLYRIVKEVRGSEGNVIAHSDVPSHAVYTEFTDGIWHSEDIACHMPHDWIPEPWFYRIFMSKQHLGMNSELLTMIGRTAGPWPTQEKALAISLVHNEWPRPRTTGLWARIPPKEAQPVADVWKALDAFGADDENVEWRPYWKNSQWMQSGDDKVLVSYWRKPGKALFCIANWTNDKKNAVVQVKDAELLTGAAKDALTGESVDFNGGRFAFPLDAVRMRLIEVDAK